jgi:hypothetical protein
MEMHQDTLWSQAVAFTKAKSPASFEQWFSGVQFDGMTDGVVSLRARDEFVREWVDQHFLPTLVDYLRSQTGWSVQVAWCVGGDLERPVASGPEARPEQARHDQVRHDDPVEPPRSQRTMRRSSWSGSRIRCASSSDATGMRSVTQTVPDSAWKRVSRTFESAAYRRSVRDGAVGAMATRPARSSSSAASKGGLSNRGQASQSIDPARDTSAAARQSPTIA